MARATLMARKCNDCFSISEIVQYEILGFAERGEGAQLIESGATSLPSGRLPVKAGGGLMATAIPSVRPVCGRLLRRSRSSQAKRARARSTAQSVFLPATPAAASGRVLWWSGKRFSDWRRRRSGAFFSRGEIWRIARCINQEFPRRFQAPRRERFWRSIENS